MIWGETQFFSDCDALLFKTCCLPLLLIGHGCLLEAAALPHAGFWIGSVIWEPLETGEEAEWESECILSHSDLYIR